MSTQTQVTIQEKLLEIDNLISALNLLSEEVRTRKDLVLTDEHLQGLLENILTNDERLATLSQRIARSIGQSVIIRGVTRHVKSDIEQHLDAYIAQQLAEPSIEARIERLIANRAAGISAAPAQSPERSLEELGYDNVEDIAERFRILAGENAWAE